MEAHEAFIEMTVNMDVAKLLALKACLVVARIVMGERCIMIAAC